MTVPFAIIAFLTLASAVAAMSLRNLVHCALTLMVTFAGLAALYLQLGAQFVGFAQILVYLGAVAILIVFAILLTRASEPPRPRVDRNQPPPSRVHRRSPPPRAHLPSPPRNGSTRARGSAPSWRRTVSGRQ